MPFVRIDLIKGKSAQYRKTLGDIAEHAEFTMPYDKEKLIKAIGEVERIHASTTEPEKSVVLVSNSFTYQEHSVHVPVKIVEGTSGRVTTAYFSGETYGGELLWSADDDK
jgi:hypothetical protein